MIFESADSINKILVDNVAGDVCIRLSIRDPMASNLSKRAIDFTKIVICANGDCRFCKFSK